MNTMTEVGGVQVGYESGIAFAHVPNVGDGNEWNLNISGVFLHEWDNRIEASPCNDLQKAFLRAKLEWLEYLRDREHEEISRPPVVAAAVHRCRYLPRAVVWVSFGLFAIGFWAVAVIKLLELAGTAVVR